MSLSKLRKHSWIEHIGYESEELRGGRLPLTKEVLAYFFYLHRTKSKGIRESARMAVRQAVEKFWSRTTIPLSQEIRNIERTEKLHSEWKGLIKSKNRENKAKIKNFKSKLNCLFDMTVKDAPAKMQYQISTETNPTRKAALLEDLKFLDDQRNEESRHGIIAGIDKNLDRVEKKKRARVERRQSRTDVSTEQMETTGTPKETGITTSAFPDSFSNSKSPSSGNGSDDLFSPSSSKLKKMKVVTPALAQTFDAANISSRKAPQVLAAAADALGVDIEDTNISRSSIYRERVKARDDTAKKLKEDFKTNDVLTVHWDGKIVPTLTGRDQVDREAIVVAGATTNRLLGAPIIEKGTGKGKKIGAAVAHHVNEWRLQKNVRAMCFDTTNTNSGWKNGAAKWVEYLLKTDLLWLPCRHHVLERILESVFTTIMGESKGPEVELFKDFQKAWKDIKTELYDIPESEDYPAILDSTRRAALIEFANAQINIGQPRVDYKELLELVIIFLGGAPREGFTFRAPGAMHHARWMSKAIYSIKVWLFRKQFPTLTEDQAESLLFVSLFVACAYIEAWYSAPYAASAGRSDLKLVSDLNDFEAIHKEAASAAQKKLEQHLWYLSEELIGLAIFDENLSDSEREKLVRSTQNNQGDDDPLKRRIMPLAQVSNHSIGDLATVNTQQFFRILGIETDFFDLPVGSWESNDNYRRGKHTVDNLSVINDHAERAVKLLQDYNKAMTNQESRFQNLLLTVSEHRKSVPDEKKNYSFKKIFTLKISRRVPC